MKLNLAIIWPNQYRVQIDAIGHVRYEVADISGPEPLDQASFQEIPRADFEAILNGLRTDSLNSIAEALDFGGAVACGDLPSIADCMATIARTVAPICPACEAEETLQSDDLDKVEPS